MGDKKHQEDQRAADAALVSSRTCPECLKVVAPGLEQQHVDLCLPRWESEIGEKTDYGRRAAQVLAYAKPAQAAAAAKGA